MNFDSSFPSSSSKRLPLAIPLPPRDGLKFVADLDLLELSDAVLKLAERLVTDGAVPPAASEDALHIAIAAVHGMHYLMTWNCKHIANAAT